MTCFQEDPRNGGNGEVAKTPTNSLFINYNYIAFALKAFWYTITHVACLSSKDHLAWFQPVSHFASSHGSPNLNPMRHMPHREFFQRHRYRPLQLPMLGLQKLVDRPAVAERAEPFGARWTSRVGSIARWR